MKKKIKILQDSAFKLIPIYFVLFILIQLSMYGIEIVFNIGHKENVMDGILIIGVIIMYVYNTILLYNSQDLK